MSELFTKVQLREKLSSFPAPYNSKLVLSNQSRECQPAQGYTKSTWSNQQDQSWSLGSIQSEGGYIPCP